MAGSVLNCFELVQRMLGLSRWFASQNINQAINDIQIRSCKRLLKDVELELEGHRVWISKLSHINAPQTSLSKLTYSQCNSHLTILKVTLEQIETLKKSAHTAVFPKILKEPVAEFNNQFKELSSKLERLVGNINDLYDIQIKDDARSTRFPDCFLFTNMVHPNPLHVFLDFESKESPECKLKEAIFQEGPNITISAVASGMGGIGKTCALRGIGLLEEAKSRFPGGILYMSLGADASKFELIRNLAEFVKQSGGARKSVEVGRQEYVANAVNLTAQWFEGHACLFLIDDVWCRNGIDPVATELLAGLSKNHRSRVAFTTRDRTVRSHTKIQFKKRNDDDAMKILMQSSGCSIVSESTSEQSALKYLLKISDGLPIALGVIGKRARYLIEDKGINEQDVWTIVSEDFQQPDEILLEEAPRDVKNETVSNVLRRSLEMTVDYESNQNCTDLFACFSILRKRQEVPVDVLQRLWGTEPQQTKKQIEILERFSIVEISHWFQGQLRMCFVIHDLFLDIAVSLADGKDGISSNVSCRVLNSYVAKKVSVEPDNAFQKEQPGPSNKKKAWCFPKNMNHIFKRKKKERASASTVDDSIIADSIEDLKKNEFREAWIKLCDDGFAHRNLFRLLDIASWHKQAIAFLLDPRWVTKQVLNFGRMQYVDDTGTVLQYLQRMGKDDYCTRYMSAIQMISAAVTESEPFFTNASFAGAMWTQLYGRLINFQSHELIESFVNAVEKFAPTPWIRSHGALTAPRPSSEKVLGVKGVQLLRSSPNYIEILNCSFDARNINFRLFSCSPHKDDLQLVKKWPLPMCNPPNIDLRLGLKATFALSTSNDILATGSQRDILVFPNDYRHTGTCVSRFSILLPHTTLRQHKEKVSSLAFSTNGKLLISGDRGGQVVIWTEDAGTWSPTLLEGHSGLVWSVKMSPDGKNAVSGSSDKTVRVWSRLENGKWNSDELNGHTDAVICVDISDDVRYVVSGSFNGLVILWERKGTEWKMSRLEGHGLLVTSVAIDAEGARVASSASDHTARIWGCNEGIWKCTAMLEEQNYMFNCIAFAARHGYVVIACNDGTVRLWNTERSHWEAAELCAYTGNAWCVSVSKTRNCAVSGLTDGNVLLWKKNGQRWKFETLMKHSEMVNAISISSYGELIVSGLRDGSVFVLEEKNGSWTTQELRGHTERVLDAAISLQGDVIATASVDKTMKIWRRNGIVWELCESFDDYDGVVWSVAFSVNASRLVSGSKDHMVRVYDVHNEGRATAQTLRGHEDEVTAVSITPDGLSIASVSLDGIFKVWAESSPGVWIEKTIGNFDQVVNVHKLTFSTDGSLLRAEETGGKFKFHGFSKRDDTWALDSTRDGEPGEVGGAFGNCELDHRSIPLIVKEMFPFIDRLWNMGDRWYFAIGYSAALAIQIVE